MESSNEIIPDRLSPGLTRPALPLPLHSSGVNCNMGWERGMREGLVFLRIGPVNVTTKVLDVSERLMVMRVIMGRTVLNLKSVYAPDNSKQMVEKEEIFALLGRILSVVDDGEKMLICGDLNGHVGAEV